MRARSETAICLEVWLSASWSAGSGPPDARALMTIRAADLAICTPIAADSAFDHQNVMPTPAPNLAPTGGTV